MDIYHVHGTIMTRAPLLICVLLPFLAAVPGNAATISFQEGVSPSASYTADAVTINILTSVPSTGDVNFNGAGGLDVGRNGGTTGGSLLSRILLEFDLSAIEAAAPSSTIDNVQLVLRHIPQLSVFSPITVDLHLLGANADFDEATVTWNNAPTTPGGSPGPLLSTLTFDAFPPLPPGDSQDLVWSSTPAFVGAATSALAGPDNTLRLLLRSLDAEALFRPDGITPNNTSLASFFNEDSVTPGFRPELIVNFRPSGGPGELPIPWPPTAWLSLPILGGIAWIRCRQLQNADTVEQSIGHSAAR